jgi:SulP family sulfate permease
LILITFLGDIAEKIPQCVLAGLLLKVGLDIIDWDFIGNLKIYPNDKIFLMFSVLFLTVFSDLITAIGLGLILSHMIYSQKMNRAQMKQIRFFETTDRNISDVGEIKRIEGEKKNSAALKLSGNINYSITKDLTTLLNKIISEYDFILLDLEDIQSVDLSVTSALQDIFKTLPKGKEISISIHEGDVYKMFESMALFKHMDAKNIHIIEGEISVHR